MEETEDEVSEETKLNDAVRERDAYFSEACRTKETLSSVIPALEKATGLNADDFRKLCPGTELTPDETAALWLARAIMEKP